MADNEMRTQIL